MGFPARTTAPTVLRFLRVVVAWVTARASAVSAFLGAVHSRLLELLTELPKDGSALRELEEKMHREVGGCLDIVTAAVLRAAHSSPEVLAQVELLRVAPIVAPVSSGKRGFPGPGGQAESSFFRLADVVGFDFVDDGEQGARDGKPDGAPEMVPPVGSPRSVCLFEVFHLLGDGLMQAF